MIPTPAGERGANHPMEYGYGFDDESPRLELSSLWFLLGVIVFAFTVLIMAAIVMGGPDRDYYLNVSQQRAQQSGPAVDNNPRSTTSTTSPSGAMRTTR
jgi:hypothetical protein